MMIHAHEHAYQQAEKFVACRVCGFQRDKWEHISNMRYVMHLGYAYGTVPEGAYVDLVELATLEPVTPTDGDIATFRQLLKSLDLASEDETPGIFEKRLTASKLVPGNSGTRRGILISLAMAGVIPNTQLSLSLANWTGFDVMQEAAIQLNNTKGRSDMEMPWAGWMGGLRVDWDKAEQWFGQYL